MSLIKLAYTPIVVINNGSQGSSKTFSTRNVAATTAGALGGFATQEIIENHLPKLGLPKFDASKFSHRLGKRLGTAGGAFIGAAGVYKYLQHKDKNKTPYIYMM